MFLWSRERKVHCEKSLCQSLDAWFEDARKLDFTARTMTERLASMVSTWPAGLGSCRLREPGEEQTLGQLGLRPMLENHDPSAASAHMRQMVALRKRFYSAKPNAFPKTKHERSREADKGGLSPLTRPFSHPFILFLSVHQIHILASSSSSATDS